MIDTSPRHPRLLPARAPRPGLHVERLLVIDPLHQRFGDYCIDELPALLGPRDLVVLNDAATLPASLRAEPELELRLLAAQPNGSFLAVALGAGDEKLATEERGPPRRLLAGELLRFGDDLTAQVAEVDPQEARLVSLRFSSGGARFWQALYARARPIQYAYLSQPLALWDVQNRYASRPWAFELPSAGRPLTFELLFELERRGAGVTWLTHAAGVSSTGSSALDRRLPLSERYDIGAEAAARVRDTLEAGGRVVAVGTSVVRALEGRALEQGEVTAGSGFTELVLDESYRPRVVDGLLTGLHEPGTSHFRLLEAFAPRRLLERATQHAARSGYLQHELGDSCLVLPGALANQDWC